MTAKAALKPLSMAAMMALLSLAAASARAAPVAQRWAVETSRPEVTVIDCYHGERLLLQASMYSYGEPVDLTGLDARLFWQTNGMGSAWWITNATVSATNVITATFTPAMDAGANIVRGFLGVAGENYRASFTLRMRQSPGASPNELTLPTRTLDCATTIFWNPTNAPWFTEHQSLAWSNDYRRVDVQVEWLDITNAPAYVLTNDVCAIVTNNEGGAWITGRSTPDTYLPSCAVTNTAVRWNAEAAHWEVYVEGFNDGADVSGWYTGYVYDLEAVNPFEVVNTDYNSLTVTVGKVDFSSDVGRCVYADRAGVSRNALGLAYWIDTTNYVDAATNAINAKVDRKLDSVSPQDGSASVEWIWNALTLYYDDVEFVRLSASDGTLEFPEAFDWSGIRNGTETLQDALDARLSRVVTVTNEAEVALVTITNVADAATNVYALTLPVKGGRLATTDDVPDMTNIICNVVTNDVGGASPWSTGVSASGASYSVESSAVEWRDGEWKIRLVGTVDGMAFDSWRSTGNSDENATCVTSDVYEVVAERTVEPVRNALGLAYAGDLPTDYLAVSNKAYLAIPMPAGTVTEGLVLTKTANGVEWIAPSGGAVGTLAQIQDTDGKWHNVRAETNKLGQVVIAVDGAVAVHEDLSILEEKARAEAREHEIEYAATNEAARAIAAEAAISEQLGEISSLGRFLSTWDSATGKPGTEPKATILTYLAGDYYIVGAVASSGEANYRPHPGAYTNGTASADAETGEVAVNDIYRYSSDGTWIHVAMSAVETDFGQIAGYPTNNTRLAAALDARRLKADKVAWADVTNAPAFVLTNDVCNIVTNDVGGLTEWTIGNNVFGSEPDTGNLFDLTSKEVSWNGSEWKMRLVGDIDGNETDMWVGTGESDYYATAITANTYGATSTRSVTARSNALGLAYERDVRPAVSNTVTAAYVENLGVTRWTTAADATGIVERVRALELVEKYEELPATGEPNKVYLATDHGTAWLYDSTGYSELGELAPPPTEGEDDGKFLRYAGGLLSWGTDEAAAAERAELRTNVATVAASVTNLTAAATNAALAAAKTYADGYAGQAPDYATVSNLASTALQSHQSLAWSNDYRRADAAIPWADVADAPAFVTEAVTNGVAPGFAAVSNAALTARADLDAHADEWTAKQDTIADYTTTGAVRSIVTGYGYETAAHAATAYQPAGDYLTVHQSLAFTNDYRRVDAKINWSNVTNHGDFVTETVTNGLASEAWVGAQGYITAHQTLEPATNYVVAATNALDARLVAETNRAIRADAALAEQVAGKQDKLPDVVYGRYLHASTVDGSLEWSEVSSGGGGVSAETASSIARTETSNIVTLAYVEGLGISTTNITDAAGNVINADRTATVLCDSWRSDSDGSLLVPRGTNYWTDGERILQYSGGAWSCSGFGDGATVLTTTGTGAEATKVIVSSGSTGYMYTRGQNLAPAGKLALEGDVARMLEDGSVTRVGTNTVGSATTPMYLVGGVPTEGDFYAGGTAVTLNGASKARDMAEFYAPTTVGTSGQYLKSSGSGAPVWATAATYWGGTAVTLNGTSKAKSTASFYAAATVGTSNQVLKSNGNGAPTWATPDAYWGGTAVTLNGTSKAKSTASFYAPTAGGAAGRMLVGNGTSAAPVFSTSDVGGAFNPVYIADGIPTACVTSGVYSAEIAEYTSTAGTVRRVTYLKLSAGAWVVVARTQVGGGSGYSRMALTLTAPNAEDFDALEFCSNTSEAYGAYQVVGVFLFTATTRVYLYVCDENATFHKNNFFRAIRL